MAEPRRPRHLLDPADIRGSHERSIGTPEALTSVRRWVMSVLVVTTILHFSAGIAIGAILIDESRVDARVGLSGLATVTGVLAVAAGLAIHGRRPVSLWLLLGLVPGAAGTILTFA